MSDVPPLGAYLQLKLSVERCSLAYACKSTTMLAGSSRDNSLNLVVFSNFFYCCHPYKNQPYSNYSIPYGIEPPF